MATLVTLVVSLLMGAIVITVTAPPAVAIITVCGIVVVAGILTKAAGKF